MKAQPAPQFSLTDQDGVTRSLKDYAGRWVVLYFYPKDYTEPCTDEARAFRDEHSVIAQFGNAEVIGISKDNVASHKKFATELNLNFPLLSDPDHETIEAYGVWDANASGPEHMRTKRCTFLINPAAMIVKKFPNVVPKNHAHDIIDALISLRSTSVTP